MLPIATTGRLGSDPVERLERGVHVRNVDKNFVQEVQTTWIGVKITEMLTIFVV